MKKKYFLCLTFFALCFALNSAKALEKKEEFRSIIVNAEGSAVATPDIAFLRIGVERKALTAEKALKENKMIMQNIMQKIKENGIDAQDIQTSQLSIYQSENPDTKAQEYHSENSVNIRIKDLSKLGKIYDDSINAGANIGDNLSFSNSHRKDLLKLAREKAVQNAFIKAKTLAQAAHVKLGHVLQIKEENDYAPLMPRSAMVLAASSGSTPIDKGELSYNVHVTVTFSIQ